MFAAYQPRQNFHCMNENVSLEKLAVTDQIVTIAKVFHYKQKAIQYHTCTHIAS